MTDDKLKKYLKDIGKTFFIEFYDYLNRYESSTEFAEAIEDLTHYTNKSLKSRHSKSKSIKEAGRVKDALFEIMNSTHSLVTEEIKNKATSLHNKI